MNCNAYVHIILTVTSKLKDVPKSQADMFIENMVISWNRAIDGSVLEMVQDKNVVNTDL